MVPGKLMAFQDMARRNPYADDIWIPYNTEGRSVVKTMCLRKASNNQGIIKKSRKLLNQCYTESNLYSIVMADSV